MEPCPECKRCVWKHVAYKRGEFLYGCNEAAVYKCCNSYSIPIESRKTFLSEDDISKLSLVSSALNF